MEHLCKRHQHEARERSAALPRRTGAAWPVQLAALAATLAFGAIANGAVSIDFESVCPTHNIVVLDHLPTGNPNLYFRESYWDYTTTYFDGSADVEQTGAVGSGCQLYFHDITAEFELGAPYPTNLSFDFAHLGGTLNIWIEGQWAVFDDFNLLHDTWWGTPPYTWIHATVTWYSGNTGRVTLTSTVSNGISFFRIGGQELIIDNVSEAPPPPENDDCDEAQPVGDGVYEFDSRGATTDGPEEGECDWWGYAHIESDIWYRYAAPVDGTATVSLCGSLYDTKLAVYHGDCPIGPGEVVACNDDDCGLQSEVSLQVLAGEEYLIRVGGYAGAQGEGVLSISSEADPVEYGLGDLNCDGLLNAFDIDPFALALSDAAAYAAAYPDCNRMLADINDDGVVNAFDIDPFTQLLAGG